MLVIEMRNVRARVWRGYTANKTGWLPRRMSWMEPEAAQDFIRMTEACENRIEFTDLYRSVRYQIRSIRGNEHKKRLYAPPTKSGHNWGWSFDAAIKESLENFRASGIKELVNAGRDRNALARWMKQFGFTGIRKERWHFNHLGTHDSTVKRIESVYGARLALDNSDVQRALNKFMGTRLDKPLTIDGSLGVKTSAVAEIVDNMLFTGDNGAFSAWFRRVLAGVTVDIEEV